MKRLQAGTECHPFFGLNGRLDQPRPKAWVTSSRVERP
jgi:hypothetical protein